MLLRASFSIALLLVCFGCTSRESQKKQAVASLRAADAPPPPPAPPGYRPPSLIRPGYDPPSLLTLTPAQQLEIYKHMEDHYVGRTVRRGANPSVLPSAARELTPTLRWQGKTYTDLTTFMVDARIAGVLVLKNGEVALERYALGHTARDRWTSFSVAKSLTSLLVGAAIQDGLIRSLDEPVTRYIPELSGSGYDGVSIRQLITMSSGVKWNEDYADPNSDVARSAIAPGDPGVNPLVSYMRRLPRVAEPGAVFSYKTGETDLVGILVANATGRGVAQYLSEKIWAPFGMEQDAYWIVDRGNMERGGCCISMTLRDYGRIALFVLGGGVAGGKQVVPEWYLKEATSNQLKPPATVGYGYFWWIHAPDSFSARGIFGQTIWVVPRERLVLVTHGAWSKAMSPQGFAAVTALFEAARAAAR